MGPDFVIQRVIAAEGGKWAELVEGDPTKVSGAKPDEGLPAVKAPVVQHLEKDVHDPTSAEILATICLFNKQKQMCHDQVRFIFSHPKNNNLQTVEKAKELRAVALETWKGLEAQMTQKIKDDALITEFGEGHRVHITLLAAQNLPMFDQVKQSHGWHSTTYRSVQMHCLPKPHYCLFATYMQQETLQSNDARRNFPVQCIRPVLHGDDAACARSHAKVGWQKDRMHPLLQQNCVRKGDLRRTQERLDCKRSGPAVEQEDNRRPGCRSGRGCICHI